MHRFCHPATQRLLAVMLALALALAGGLLAGCASRQPAALAAAPQQSVDLSGHWEIDRRHSERARDKILWLYQQAVRDAQRLMDLRDAPRRGGPSRHVWRRAEAVAGLGQLAEYITRAGVLDIRQRDGEIVIGRDGDFALACDLALQGPLNPGLGEERCGWLGDTLVFAMGLPEGLTVYHLIQLIEGPRRITIATTVHHANSNERFSLNRVYRPYVPAAAPYDCEYRIATRTTCTLGEQRP